MTDEKGSAMATTTYGVEGMTCEHCVRSVSEEVAKIPGVTEVSVDLEGGTVTVTGNDVAIDELRAAIDEAGYSLVA